jgi:transcriptional regulator with XRE-family HTH domain
MRREHTLARLLRALSGKTQEQLAEEIGVTRSLIAQIEQGEVVPSRDHLEAMAESAGITLSDAEEILRLYETYRRAPQRWGGPAGRLLDRMAETLRAHADAAYQRFLTLPLPDSFPTVWDEERAKELFARLEDLPEESRWVLVQGAEEFQTWALCERVCLASVHAASREVESAAAWARLAQEIAARVRGPEEFRNRLQGYALGHVANVLRVSGELREADATLEQAKRLWSSGSDPGGVLDPGRLLDLEASLRRAQRRLDEALALLDKAAAVGRQPERILVQKGFTLETMGEYERAAATLLQAKPLVERQGDVRLSYMLCFNLAVSYCHLGRYVEAAELMQQVRELVLQRGDENEAIRVTWLQGRIAAGQGRLLEARGLLGQARRAFERRGSSYDAALALLEEALLLLDEGRTAEVKELARELAVVFDAQGVHREALAALRLFYEAADREQATAELVKQLLDYLCRARHDAELRFEYRRESPR